MVIYPGCSHQQQNNMCGNNLFEHYLNVLFMNLRAAAALHPLLLPSESKISQTAPFSVSVLLLNVGSVRPHSCRNMI